jgi:hypothetical protein
MAVALDDKYARAAGLPHSTKSLWNTKRSVYYLKGFYDLHCLVKLDFHNSLASG